MKFSDCSKGKTVHHAIARCTAKIVRPVKSRRIVTIEFLDGPCAGRWHDADPVNLTEIDQNEGQS